MTFRLIKCRKSFLVLLFSLTLTFSMPWAAYSADENGPISCNLVIIENCSPKDGLASDRSLGGFDIKEPLTKFSAKSFRGSIDAWVDNTQNSKIGTFYEEVVDSIFDSKLIATAECQAINKLGTSSGLGLKIRQNFKSDYNDTIKSYLFTHFLYPIVKSNGETEFGLYDIKSGVLILKGSGNPVSSALAVISKNILSCEGGVLKAKIPIIEFKNSITQTPKQP